MLEKRQHGLEIGIALITSLGECMNASHLVIARFSHTLGKVAVHQRLVDKDGLIYSL